MHSNNKLENYRGLSIASILMGIMAFFILIPLMFYFAPIIGNYILNIIPEDFLILFIISCYAVCFPVPAIVCGSIDLKRIKSGRYSNKGKGFDIFGIVLGSVFIIIPYWFIVGGMILSY